jgi:hypothetical protein
VRRPEGEAVECGLLPEALVDGLGPRYGGDVLDELREAVARVTVDRDALHRVVKGFASTPTPAWARDRFPDLDPDTGRKALARNSDLPKEELHPPTAELEAETRGLADD